MALQVGVSSALFFPGSYLLGGIAHQLQAGVDVQSRNKTLRVRQGTTVIYTSHSTEEVEQLCTRVAIMDRGRVIAAGTTAALKGHIKQGGGISVETYLLGPSYFVQLTK